MSQEKLVEENNKLQLQVYLLLQTKSRIQWKLQLLGEENQVLKNILQQNLKKHVDEWAQQFQRRTNTILQEFEFLRNDELQFLNPAVDTSDLPYGYHSVEKPLLEQINSLKMEIQQLQLQYESFVDTEHTKLRNSYYELLGEHEATQSRLLQVNEKNDTLKKENAKLLQEIRQLQNPTLSTDELSVTDHQVVDSDSSDEEETNDYDASTDPESRRSAEVDVGPQKLDLDEQIISMGERRKRLPSMMSKVPPQMSASSSFTSGSFISHSSANPKSQSSPNLRGPPPSLPPRRHVAGLEKKIRTGHYFEKSSDSTLIVEYPLSMAKNSGKASVKASIIVTEKLHKEPVDCLVVSNTADLDCNSERNAYFSKQLNGVTQAKDSIILQCKEYLLNHQTDLEKITKRQHVLEKGSVFCGQLDDQCHVIHVYVSKSELKSTTSVDDNLSKLRLSADPIYKDLVPAIKNVMEAADALGCNSIALCPIVNQAGVGQYGIADDDWLMGYRCMFASICEYYAENKISTNLMDMRICVPSNEQAQSVKKVLDRDFVGYIARNVHNTKAKSDLQRNLSVKVDGIITKKPKVQEKVEKKREPKDPVLYYSVDYKSIVHTPIDDTKETIEFMDDNSNEGADNADTPIEIKCASLEKLIERVTYHTTYDNAYLYAFLLTYRSFTTPHELFEKLINRYNMPPPNQSSITHLDFAQWYEEVLNKIRLRVSQMIKKWIENHFYDFENDEELVRKVLEFTDMMEKTQGEAYATQIRRALKKQQSSDSQRQVVTFDKDDISVPTLFPNKYNPNDLTKVYDILEWPSAELARQITLIEYEMFHGIQPKECLNQSWNKSNREERAPHIFKMINWFNTVSKWVATCVINEENPKQRKLTLTKMIHLAEACYDLNNFNAIFEIISGLQNAAVHRLRKTWESLSASTRRSYDRLYDIISRDNNYRNIRRAILDVKPPCIPYIGVFLTDLTFIEDGNPDVLNGKINFIKRRKLAMLIRDIQTYQQTPYKLHPVPSLQEQLRLIDGISEDQLFNRSLILEPRKKVA